MSQLALPMSAWNQVGNLGSVGDNEPSYLINILMVGGGGAGGTVKSYSVGGGGGGGAVIEQQVFVGKNTNYTLIVGGGGDGSPIMSAAEVGKQDGGDTVFGTLTARGGAGGAYQRTYDGNIGDPRGRNTGGSTGGAAAAQASFSSVAGTSQPYPTLAQTGFVSIGGQGVKTITANGAFVAGGGGGAGYDTVNRSTYVTTIASLLLAGFNVSNIDIPGMTFVMGGEFIGSTSDGTLMSLNTSVAGQATFWVVTFNGGFTKAVQVQFADSDAGVTVVALQAKYATGDVRGTGFNFNTSGTSQVVATSNTSTGYGIASISGLARGGGKGVSNASSGSYGGKGGDGYSSTITGTLTRYGAGGGGALRYGSIGFVRGLGGAGGGGNGGVVNQSGFNATGWGCGGGGASDGDGGNAATGLAGGNGSDGVIYISIPMNTVVPTNHSGSWTAFGNNVFAFTKSGFPAGGGKSIRFV